jgi:hypothetical protein
MTRRLVGFRYIGVNQRDLKTVYDADCVDPSFSIVKPVIHALQRAALSRKTWMPAANARAARLRARFRVGRRPFENPGRILEGDSMTCNVPRTQREQVGGLPYVY